jgi:quercetin dioxygenase-like cupin family protein
MRDARGSTQRWLLLTAGLAKRRRAAAQLPLKARSGPPLHLMRTAAAQPDVRWLRHTHTTRGNVPPRRIVRARFATILGAALLACGKSEPANDHGKEQPPVRSEGLVLQLDEGERRERRNVGKGPFILKVDRQNGGSPDLVMGYEELAPGVEIQLHRHLIADEIIFVHRGSGTVSLNGRVSPVRAGATVYIPREVTVGMVNTDTVPLGIAFVFSKPGFEEMMRDNSVLEGQPVPPMSPDERARIQARHKWHTITGPRT